MSRNYRHALFFGIFPLLAGLLIFLAWLPTRWRWLEEAGSWMLMAGTVLVCCGWYKLYRFRLVDSNKLPPRRVFAMLIACLALFASNFAAALLIMAEVYSITRSERAPVEPERLGQVD